MTEQLPLELGHRAALGRDDFLISDSNREAVGWIDAWPNWTAPGLVIVGPPASGKSHLAQVWCARAGAEMVDRRELAEPHAAARLAERERIVIDDADRTLDERNLLHLYNLIVERGG
ncbi:MAG TPA: DNA replication protein, partial [Alphaproteobacteria bacterium]|nr:DNA replication protein [Alphaproteobacteria bacterium]